MSQQLRDWAKKALEMLEDNHHLVADNEKHAYVMMHLEVIKNGKALLEQPVQEPVALKPCRSPYCECADGKCTHPGCYDARQEEFTFPAQPEPVREPFGYFTVNDYDMWEETGDSKYGIPLYARPQLDHGYEVAPLETQPPNPYKQLWVGLTRTECLQIEKDMMKYYDYQHECKTVCLPEFARAIEAKLKEKNAAQVDTPQSCAYHPCTYILIEGLKNLQGGRNVLARWDDAREVVDAKLREKNGGAV